MALPMNATPTYTITIPSTKEEFKFRPFLVKDEKALLIAQQSEDPTVMLDTVKEVIKACAKTSLDIDRLPSFDVEYIFLQMRAKSVGEFVDLIFQCDTDHGAENEKARSTVRIDLTKVGVEFPENHTNKIPVFGDVGIVMKYPNIETLKKLEVTAEDDLDGIFDIVTECIDYIYDTDEVFAAKDQNKEELIHFIDNLTSEQFERVQEFFQTMPSLKTWIDYKCPVCGKDHHKYMEGLQSFF